MVRDPEHHLARLPDGFASGSIALRTVQCDTITTDDSGNARLLFTGHPAGPIGVDLTTAGGNMVIALGAGTDGHTWCTGQATGSVQLISANANPDLATYNTYGSRWRPLAACLRFQYIGPHGDSQTGYTVVLQGDMNWSNITAGGFTPDWAVPFVMGTAAATTLAAGTDGVIQSNPKARTYRCGEDFYVPLPCLSVESQEWRDLGAAQQGYQQTWIPSPAATAVSTASQYSQFAGLGSVAVAMYGMANGTSAAVYRVTQCYTLELIPQTKYNVLIPPVSVPPAPAAITAGEGIMAKLRDVGSAFLDGTMPYLSDPSFWHGLGGAGVAAASTALVRRGGRRGG